MKEKWGSGTFSWSDFQERCNNGYEEKKKEEQQVSSELAMGLYEEEEKEEKTEEDMKSIEACKENMLENEKIASLERLRLEKSIEGFKNCLDNPKEIKLDVLREMTTRVRVSEKEYLQNEFDPESKEYSVDGYYEDTNSNTSEDSLETVKPSGTNQYTVHEGELGPCFEDGYTSATDVSIFGLIFWSIRLYFNKNIRLLFKLYSFNLNYNRFYLSIRIFVKKINIKRITFIYSTSNKKLFLITYWFVLSSSQYIDWTFIYFFILYLQNTDIDFFL